MLAQDGGSNSAIVSLSDEVIVYEDTIRKYAKEYDIEDYVSLLQAIMMQESGGKGNDPMQASESGYNTKYPRVPNGITDPEYSIEVGTHTFSDCLKKAKVKDSSDTERIYLLCRDIIMALAILNGQFVILVDILNIMHNSFLTIKNKS